MNKWFHLFSIAGSYFVWISLILETSEVVLSQAGSNSNMTENIFVSLTLSSLGLSTDWSLTMPDG